ncbi:MAG: MBL fold metallo-hydrolase [Anaerolineaceae bacterium]|nr:MBL fold metallo-hydrolase [Anaerolineaceae bacterium]
MLAKLIVNGLYAIPIGPVNTFLLVSTDGCTLIDTGFPGSANTILQAVREVGKSARDIRHIILTHAHPDHIGSAAVLKKATGAATYIHPLDAPIAMGNTGFRPMKPAPGLINGLLFRMIMRSTPSVEGVPIDHQVQDGEVLPIAGGLTAIHAPGHCAGQLAFLWARQGGVLLAADTCSNMMGLGWTVGYEDLEEGKRSLSRLGQLDFQVACFGHGKALRRDADVQFRKKWGEEVV